LQVSVASDEIVIACRIVIGGDLQEMSFIALSLASKVSRCELKLVICMLVLMFAGGLGDLYTEESKYVLLCTLASMVIDSNTLSTKVDSSAISLYVMAFFI
jgi:hypothetical protein